MHRWWAFDRCTPAIAHRKKPGSVGLHLWTLHQRAARKSCGVARRRARRLIALDDYRLQLPPRRVICRVKKGVEFAPNRAGTPTKGRPPTNVGPTALPIDPSAFRTATNCPARPAVETDL